MNPTAPVLMVLLVVASVVAPVAAAENEPPLVDAGLDQRVPEGSVVLLDGGGAVDPDGEIVSYEWSIETPRGETIRPEEPTAMVTRFVPERVGRYRVTLVATDDDGATGEDTLYVDVAVSVGEGGGGPDTADPGNRGGAPSINPPSDVLPAAFGSDAVEVQNRPPVGQILGPDEVYAGETRRFVIQASDVDGRVVDYWWLKGAITGGDSLQFEPHRSGKSYTFDLEPGAVAEITAMVKDDDGARTRISKEVKVLNNPPTVRIEGKETVSVGSVHRYKGIASDQEGRIVSYSWSTSNVDASISKISGGISQLRSRSHEPEYQWFQFQSIPKRDATATLSVSVRDEHGEMRRAEKKIIVIENIKSKIGNPVESASPEIESKTGQVYGVSIDSVFLRNSLKNPGQITFIAKAQDIDSSILTYYWSFGNEGYAQTVDKPTPESSSTVTFLFEPLESMTTTYEISVTVVDDSGRKATLSRDLTLEMATLPAYPGGGNIKILQGTGIGDGLVTGIVTIPNRIDESASNVVLRYGDGTSKRFEDSREEKDQYRFQFRHQYKRSGKYTLYLVDSNADGASMGHRTIKVQRRKFTEYHYQLIEKNRLTTISRLTPGSNWTRVALDHYERELIGTERTTTPITGTSALAPGEDWVKQGVTTKTVIESITQRGTSSPGPEWEIKERGVDTRKVVDGWKTVVLDSKRLAQPSWQLEGRIPRTTKSMEYVSKPNRPSGSGWQRVGSTGNYIVTGYDRVWFSNRHLAGTDWRYLGSDPYIRGYAVSKRCMEYAEFFSRRTCVDWRTTSTPIWDTRYLFEKPEYSPVYKWERTVERRSYDYRYRFKTYRTVDVNLYTKTSTQERDFAVWSKPTYREYPIYLWEKFVTEKKEKVSLTRPVSSRATNITKHTHRCAEKPGKVEKEGC